MNANENEDKVVHQNSSSCFFLIMREPWSLSPIKSDKAIFIIKNDNMMIDHDPLASYMHLNNLKLKDNILLE